jgi:hypothetical protein
MNIYNAIVFLDKMLLLFIVYSFAAVHRPTTTTRRTHPATVDPATLIDPACGFSRKQCIACLLDVADANHDGRITAAEIDKAKDTYLRFYELAVISTLAKDAETSSIINNCDANGDGVITYDDMVVSADTCLNLYKDNDKAKGTTGLLCYTKEYFCDRAAERLGE